MAMVDMDGRLNCRLGLGFDLLT